MVATDRAVLPASTKRGRGTREALLVAARSVLERDGYQETRITDIAAEAGVAHGTFYAHFRSKPEILLALMADLWSRLVVSGATEDSDGSTGTPYERVLASNERFLTGYRDNARLFAVVEQASATEPDVRLVRRRIHDDNTDRVMRAVRRWQRAGLAVDDLRPLDAATAFVAMASRSAYHWYVVEQRRTAGPESRTLTRLWLRGLGIAVPDLPRGTRRPG